MEEVCTCSKSAGENASTEPSLVISVAVCAGKERRRVVGAAVPIIAPYREVMSF